LNKGHTHDDTEGITSETSATELQKLLPKQSGSEPSMLSVFKKIWVGAVNVFFTFVVTLGLFPGFTVLFRNYDSATKNVDFAGNLIGIFQLCDFIGRTAPRWVKFPPPKYLWIAILARIVFFPLFLLLVYTDIFSSPKNVIAYIVMILFSLTNGYWSTVGMVYGPANLEPKEQEVGGFLMGFSLQFGVFMGVHLAMILLACAGVSQL